MAVLLAVWASSVRHRLVAMDGNVNNAMAQIGVHISSRFDALEHMLELAGGCAGAEATTLLGAVRARRVALTSRSAVPEVIKQEAILDETLRRVCAMADRHEELKANESYIKYMGAAQSIERMTRTARLIYNDSAAKLNRSVRSFPTNLIAGLLGFHQRDYLEIAQDELQ